MPGVDGEPTLGPEGSRLAPRYRVGVAWDPSCAGPALVSVHMAVLKLRSQGCRLWPLQCGEGARGDPECGRQSQQRLFLAHNYLLNQRLSLTLVHSQAIGAHCSASVALSFFIFERWECTTYWYIFVFCRYGSTQCLGMGEEGLLNLKVSPTQAFTPRRR